VAVDVSHHAVTLAQDNATRLKAYNLRVLQSDWFSALSNATSFDLIVSNPPYIAANDPHLQQGDLRFEPLGALASGPEGLDDIRRIVREAQPFMAPGASLIIEHGYNQEALVQDLMAQAGYRAIKSHIDLQGHPRITVARYGKSVLLENDP
jgi:release factor glutamine methyltransferase